MSKFLLIFISISLFAFKPSRYWALNDTIYLPKDYPAIYTIAYKKKFYRLIFRWTLYKNNGIVMLYNYQDHPFQNILYKNNQLNGYKIYITKNDEYNDPYLMIYFKNYQNEIAQFNILLFNPKKDVKIGLNEIRYRKLKFVKKLKPLYQPQFEAEIPYKEIKDE